MQIPPKLILDELKGLSEMPSATLEGLYRSWSDAEGPDGRSAVREFLEARGRRDFAVALEQKVPLALDKKSATQFPRALNLFSGDLRRPGAWNVDIEALPGVDEVGDARKLRFPDHSFKEIFGDAVPPALLTQDGDQLAREMFRLLKPGGKLTLTFRAQVSPKVEGWFQQAGFVNVRFSNQGAGHLAADRAG